MWPTEENLSSSPGQLLVAALVKGGEEGGSMDQCSVTVTRTVLRATWALSRSNNEQGDCSCICPSRMP